MIKDSNAVLITNLLQEWFPNTEFCVELTCNESIQMIEDTVFKNSAMDTSFLFSTRYMSSKIMDVTLLYKLTSYLSSDPLTVEFLNLILENSQDKPNILPLKITKHFEGKTFSQLQEELLFETKSPML